MIAQSAEQPMITRIASIFALALFGVLSACAASSTHESTSSDEDDLVSSATRAPDSGKTDSAANDPGDGMPVRQPCTSKFGNGLSGSFGRLDGVIVAVVSPGHGGCNADAHHVHLQVLSGGQIYDVAVNTDSGFYLEHDLSLPGAAWSDGWHTGVSLDYPRDMGVRSSDFTSAPESTMTQVLETALANANHVSVFATTYNHSGIHLVHRNGGGHDGAVIIDPLSSHAHAYIFHFSNQSF
jgi:hypothetical protein